MPSIINSDDGVVSGTSGLKTTGGNDGLLNIQSNGSTVVAVTGSGISVTGTVSQTGVSTFAAGTVSAPSITFTGDTNTGIFSPAADTIAFTEGGVESMRISSSGTLMVNTTTEASAPEAVKMLASSSANTALQLNKTTTGGCVYSNAGDSTNNGAGFQIYSYTGAIGSETYTKVLSNDGATRTIALQGGTLSAGIGIAFPATQSASSDANTLDDYEEGTWTPILTGAGGSAGSIAYSTQVGRYVKIGRLVILTGFLTLSNKGSWTDTIRIGGFPFAVANEANTYSASALYAQNVTLPANSYGVGGYPDQNQTYARLFTNNATGSANLLDYQGQLANNSQLGAWTFVYFATN